MKVVSVSPINGQSNSSKKVNFNGLGTRPIVKVQDGIKTVIYPNLNFSVQKLGDENRELITLVRNLKTGKLISHTIEGHNDPFWGGYVLPFRSEINPKTGAIKRYYNEYYRYLRPIEQERGLFYDSKGNLLGDFIMRDGSSFTFEAKKTTLAERIKIAKQESSVKGFINKLLGRKAQIVCTRYDSQDELIGSAELPSLEIEDVLLMSKNGELEKLCK